MALELFGALRPCINKGKPSTTEEVGDPTARAEALKFLLYGGDEPRGLRTMTLPYDWPVPDYEDDTGPDESIKEESMYDVPLQELVKIDRILSEEVNEPVTQLPSSNLKENIEYLKERLDTWFAVPGVHEWRLELREMINTLNTLESDLEEGRVDAEEGLKIFNEVYSRAVEITSDLDM